MDALGALDNDRFLSMVYSAADVFVICSSQDNLPNTVLEALACGVPVVGVGVGGIPDMVRSGETGITVSSADANDLSAAICRLLSDSSGREAMKATCRRVAVADTQVFNCKLTLYGDLRVPHLIMCALPERFVRRDR